MAAAPRPPRPARLLGFAGLLPPLAAVAAEIGADLGPVSPDVVLPAAAILAVGYAALILSFLGGMWWGAAAARVPAERLGGYLVAAVLPSLWAGLALVLGVAASPALPGPLVAAALLAAGLAASLLVDRRLQREGVVPGWWLGLRVPLSCSLAVLTLLAAVLG